MKIHPVIATAIVTAIFAVQAWTLSEVIALKVSVAELKLRVTNPYGYAVAKPIEPTER